MRRYVPLLKILVCSLPMLGLGACASTQKWSAQGGDRQHGVVRLSYEYPEFHQPAMSEAQAETMALERCNSWGYRKVEPIAGQIRQCANVDDGNCNLWTVTREFQCSDSAASYASRLSR